MLTRFLASALLLFAVSAVFGGAQAQDGEWRHATGLTGEPKYPAGFAHFDYVNPQAPKGGLVRFAFDGGFDTFNPILPEGNPAPGLGDVIEALMASSFDEADISAQYGLIAEAMKHPADFASVSFRLNPSARWHDGQPITAEDVVWSFEQIVKNDPYSRNYYSHVTKAEVSGEREVTFTFDAPGNRELPHIMGQLRVLPKHWWEGKDAQGRQRDISKSTLEPPLGSGPYRVKTFQANRSVLLERVSDYWAKDLNVNVGSNNFDEIRYDSYRDNTVLVEAFKGGNFDFRFENSAKAWATQYNTPARTEGKIILEEFPDQASGNMQAFVLNLRRPQFNDPRVRRALNLAFNFEQLKERVFFGQYKRVTSYFNGTELASSGLPQGKELEILESVRDKVPPEVFTTPYTNPVADTPEQARNNLREAIRLLESAGYEMRGRQMVHKDSGSPLIMEALIFDSGTERYFLPYKQDLAKVGVTLSIRSVDQPQYIERLRKRDFDMITSSWGQSLSPGNEQRAYWGSAAADQANSPNYAGIKDPGIDALIEKVIYARDREELIAATKALDRVLLWNHFVVPQWDTNVFRTARWDRFGRPANIPPYTTGFPSIWWYDSERAQRIGPQ